MKGVSLTALVLTLTLASIGFSTPLTKRQVPCTAPIARKEWRSIPATQQSKYIEAVKCLQRLPAITTATVPGAVSKFDDFQGVHITLSDFVHYVGQFLPWHRYYLWIYEKALRDECGYTEGQPYWDWTLDYQNLPASPIFDPTTGFGGNGQPSKCTNGVCTVAGCIADGPFKDQVVHLGPFNSKTRNNYCLKREFSTDPGITSYFSPAGILATTSQPTYETFRNYLEGVSGLFAGQHGAGHGAIGGQMQDLYASPSDPLFYFHHASVDRMWWQWEEVSPEQRQADMSGPSRRGVSSSPNVTLDYVISIGSSMAPDVTIRDLMNIKGTTLCYNYE